jgi:hypothetical protein
MLAIVFIIVFFKVQSSIAPKKRNKRIRRKISTNSNLGINLRKCGALYAEIYKTIMRGAVKMLISGEACCVSG